MGKYSNKIHGQLSPSAAYKIPVNDERRCSRVVSDARLRSKKSLEDREIETGLCHPTTGKLFVNSAVNRHLFRIWEREAAKGEGLASPFICC